MGLLDDAIREHLELKRKRGGDDGEVARQENEIFGDGLPASPTPAVDEPLATGIPAPLAEPADAIVDEPLADVPAPAVADDADAHRIAVEPEPEPVPPAAEAALADSVGQPTVEFSVEEYLAEQEASSDPGPAAVQHDVIASEGVADEDEDLLEGTPDFLQETPEHDRLWFEQKPPRDFDFDG